VSVFKGVSPSRVNGRPLYDGLDPDQLLPIGPFIHELDRIKLPSSWPIKTKILTADPELCQMPTQPYRAGHPSLFINKHLFF
jgi:hypothetical protein